MSKAHGKEYVENNFSPNNGQLQQQQPQVQQQQHYFDAKKNTQVLPCQFCEETFVRKNDLVIHLENVHHLPMHLVTGSQVCADRAPLKTCTHPLWSRRVTIKILVDADTAGKQSTK